MKIEVRVPTLSESIASGTLLPWRKQVGETVARDEPLVDLETDKVILEIPAPASGTLVEVVRPEGAVVKADEVVAVIETGEGVIAPTPAAKTTQPAAAAPVTPAAASKPAPVKASVPLPTASAAGESPLPNPLPLRGTEVPQAGEGANAMPTPINRQPMSRLRQRVAERLVAAQHTAAMLTTFNEVNMQPVNELRQRFKAEFEVKHGVKLGYMSFFVRAVCRALEQFPIVNAAIDGNDLVWHGDRSEEHT